MTPSTLLPFIFISLPAFAFSWSGTVNIIRHGEKCVSPSCAAFKTDPSGGGLSADGKKRRDYLAATPSAAFGGGGFTPSSSNSAIIYADGGSSGHREHDLIAPLAQHLGIKMAKTDLTSKFCAIMNGQAEHIINGLPSNIQHVLIVFEHGCIPSLTKKLGGGVPTSNGKWSSLCGHYDGDSDGQFSNPGCYDDIWSFGYRTGARATILSEGFTGLSIEEAVADEFYRHHVDEEDHKCFEASSSSQFASKGISDSGQCPASYNTVDKSVVVEQCPDDVTSIRYCSSINVTIATKGKAAVPNDNDAVLPLSMADSGFDFPVWTIGKYLIEKYGQDIIALYRAAQGTAPYKDRAFFNFALVHENKTLDVSMPDNDKVRVTSSWDDGVPKDAIKVALKCTRDDWWKAITMHQNNTYLETIVETYGATGKEFSALIYGEDLKNPLVLSKAKTFGIHANMHLLQDVLDMEMGRTYHFDWYDC